MSLIGCSHCHWIGAEEKTFVVRGMYDRGNHVFLTYPKCGIILKSVTKELWDELFRKTGEAR